MNFPRLVTACLLMLLAQAAALPAAAPGKKAVYSTAGMPWGLKEDMRYVAARALLASHGIYPVKYAVSARRVKGTPRSVLIKFPEVEYCKANTRSSCVFSFKRASDGQYFSLFTYGDPEEGGGASMRVENMTFDKCWKRGARICYPPINLTPDYQAPAIFP